MICKSERCHSEEGLSDEESPAECMHRAEILYSKITVLR